MKNNMYHSVAWQMKNSCISGYCKSLVHKIKKCVNWKCLYISNHCLVLMDFNICNQKNGVDRLFVMSNWPKTLLCIDDLWTMKCLHTFSFVQSLWKRHSWGVTNEVDGRSGLPLTTIVPLHTYLQLHKLTHKSHRRFC